MQQLMAATEHASLLQGLPGGLSEFLKQQIDVLQPSTVYLCDGSDTEAANIIQECYRLGMIKPLTKMNNCWLARTDPADVARVESKTFIVTPTQRETTTVPLDGSKSILGNWMDPEHFAASYNIRFPGCMKGRTMYIIPFSMGPPSSSMAKIGVQVTDSPYVVASMRIMTRIGAAVLQKVVDGAQFVRCVHSVGQPLPMKNPPIHQWPCNPDKTLIAHLPHSSEIISFGSGYGGNSLLGKKCLALRLGSNLARQEGWLAEHMLILGITNPQGRQRFIAAAFPSACGKTNLAMLQPTLPGYRVECVGDDICWMRFDAAGQLRAINPENGFFGVAPGTSLATNPIAMNTIRENTIFTNVAETSDGGVFWEGLEKEVDLAAVKVIDWQKQFWTPGQGRPAAHPNSRFCTPAAQCPIISPHWEDPRGVVIEAILFGGRRPEGVPLIYEARDWVHGVLIGAGMRSEATAAAEHAGKQIMHDPFAMRPFFGYNFGHYLQHWLSFGDPARQLQLPRIFHVNWFRKNANGKFLWPGFGDNVRVLDWIIRRIEGEEGIAQDSPIGWLPSEGSVNVAGIQDSYPHLDMKELFSLTKQFWLAEIHQIELFLTNQVGTDLPEILLHRLAEIRASIDSQLM